MSVQFLGDVNGDGKITEEDMLMVFMYKSGAITLDNEQLLRADVDGNGAVTLADALAIKKHIEGISIIDGVIE